MMTDRASVFNCSCGAVVVPPNEIALKMIESAGACHKCRLAKTVEFLRQNDAELLDDVLRFTEDYAGFRLKIPCPDMTVGEWIDLAKGG